MGDAVELDQPELGALMNGDRATILGSPSPTDLAQFMKTQNDSLESQWKMSQSAMITQNKMAAISNMTTMANATATFSENLTSKEAKLMEGNN